MPKDKRDEDSLSEDELREAWEVLKEGSTAQFGGKRAVENAAPRKSPKAGLFHCAWKSRNRGRISTFSTAPATTGKLSDSTGKK